MNTKCLLKQTSSKIHSYSFARIVLPLKLQEPVHRPSRKTLREGHRNSRFRHILRDAQDVIGAAIICHIVHSSDGARPISASRKVLVECMPATRSVGWCIAGDLRFKSSICCFKLLRLQLQLSQRVKDAPTRSGEVHALHVVFNMLGSQLELRPKRACQSAVNIFFTPFTSEQVRTCSRHSVCTYCRVANQIWGLLATQKFGFILTFFFDNPKKLGRYPNHRDTFLMFCVSSLLLHKCANHNGLTKSTKTLLAQSHSTVFSGSTKNPYPGDSKWPFWDG